MDETSLSKAVLSYVGQVGNQMPLTLHSKVTFGGRPDQGQAFFWTFSLPLGIVYWMGPLRHQN